MLATEFHHKLERVSKIEGYLVPGQEKTLFRLANSAGKKPIIVELGSYLGRSTACLAYGSSPSSKIFAIDTFEGNKKDFISNRNFQGGNYYAKFEENMRKLGLLNKVKPVQGYTKTVGKKWNTPIDLLFIDASHTYKDVKNDFNLFYPWVKPGGIVAFHDVTKKFPGVYRVWNEEAAKKLRVYRNDYTLYYGIKPKTGQSLKQLETKLQEITFGKNNTVHILIPVHNRLAFTKKCLNSISSQSYKYLKTIVIDDGSTDETSKYIKKHYRKVKIIKGLGNWWWTKSINKGVEEALKDANDNDYVLTMNNDCFFKSNYIRNLISASRKNKEAIVGSLILNAKKTNEVLGGGIRIVWQKSLIYSVASKISSDIKFYTDREIIKDLDTLPGKGTLIPIETFFKIGLFNSKLLPHYLADYEFFNRAKSRGIPLVVSAKSQLFNFSKETGDSRKPQEKNSLKRTLYLMFGRKSKNNILDYSIFVLLRCPKKHLLKNVSSILVRTTSQFPIIARVRLIIHNFPIYIRQTPARLKKYFS